MRSSADQVELEFDLLFTDRIGQTDPIDFAGGAGGFHGDRKFTIPLGSVQGLKNSLRFSQILSRDIVSNLSSSALPYRKSFRIKVMEVRGFEPLAFSLRTRRLQVANALK